MDVNLIQAERNWLRERVRKLGSYDAGTRQLGGRPANAMVEYALGGAFPARERFPADTAELDACLATRETAPAHLHALLDEVLAAYSARELPAGHFGPIALGDFAAMLEVAGGQFTIGPGEVASGQYPEGSNLAERQWLRERARGLGGLFQEGVLRSWGRSANALIDYALGGPWPEPFKGDGSDLAACEAAAASAPVHLQARMERILVEFRAALTG